MNGYSHRGQNAYFMAGQGPDCSFRQIIHGHRTDSRPDEFLYGIAEGLYHPANLPIPSFRDLDLNPWAVGTS